MPKHLELKYLRIKCLRTLFLHFTGKIIWLLRYHMPLVNISLPRQLPDLDGDQVSELVASCAVTFPSEIGDNHLHPRTNFILISGGKGRLLGRPYLVETCTDIGAINVTSNLALQFDCTSQRGRKYIRIANQKYLQINLR